MDQHISRQLNQVVRRLIRLRRWWALSWVWSLTALASAILVMALPPDGTAIVISNVLLVAAALTPVRILRPRRVSEQEKPITA